MDVRERGAIRVGTALYGRGVALNCSGHYTIASRAFHWLCPWTGRTFPGFQRHILSLLPRPYKWSAVQHLRRDRRRMPSSSARALAAAIEVRVIEGQALILELREYADAEDARVKPLHGFFRVEKEPFRR